MRIEQFIYLAEVANCKSISVAAQNLFTTQPNISKALKALETELNLTLFTRQKNAIILTPEGADILEYARNILQQLEMIKVYARRHDRALAGPLQGELKIITPPQMRIMLSEVFTKFHAQHEEVRISMIIHETSQILDNLQNIDADIFFANVNSIDTAAKELLDQYRSDAYKISFLFNERGYLFTACDQPFSYKKELSLKDLVDIPLGCVKNEKGSSDFLNQYLTQKYNCTFSLCVNESDPLLHRVLSGYCSALVTPTSISEYFKKNGKVIPLQENIYKSVYIATSTDPAKQELIEAFLEALSEQIAQEKLSTPV